LVAAVVDHYLHLMAATAVQVAAELLLCFLLVEPVEQALLDKVLQVEQVIQVLMQQEAVALVLLVKVVLAVAVVLAALVVQDLILGQLGLLLLQQA
jgi:hypothetical protein